MKYFKYTWIVGALVTLVIIAFPVIYFWPKNEPVRDDPSAYLPLHLPHTDHTHIVQGPFETGSDVTRACMDCHADSAVQVMATSHWTWESEPFDVPWREGTVTIGKKNQINNFCIGTQGNQKSCTTCHVGYGWEDENFDFDNPESIDCLACHADANLYAKGNYGYPVEEVDLLAAAQSVRNPTRENCGACHFDGGGGNAVKHGELNQHLFYPEENLDIHMGGMDFLCTDCHITQDHQIKGRLVPDNYKINPDEQVYCTNCHSLELHQDQRINAHTTAVACQTCHIPLIGVKEPTKVFWDWSTAGDDSIEENVHEYLKIKGTFEYGQNLTPTYVWFNGDLEYRYLLGDKIDPSEPTMVNLPAGDIDDPRAQIFPFKVHIAKQPYDTVNQILLQPLTAREDGYWATFDWPSALEIGAEITGLEFSGEYDFAETWMYWPVTHTVRPAQDALVCDNCHGPEGRMDWEALGYYGDPIEWGGRFQSNSYQP